MKAISIKQPWASLIIAGIKPVENRKKPWYHKGPVAIHASKQYDHCAADWILNNIDDMHGIVIESESLTGGFIGTVNMVDCVQAYSGKFFFGPWGYVFKDPKKCELIPWKGQQGVFNIDTYSIDFRKMRKNWYFGRYFDCGGCGNMLEQYPITGDCPHCGNVILPF